MTDMELLEQTLNGIVRDIRDSLESTGTNASGKTSESLEVDMYDGGGMVKGRPFFQSVETGRPPGRVPQRFGLIIRQWMRDKGIAAPPMPYKRKPSQNWQPKYTPEERGAMAMAHAIAYKIEHEGTRLFRDGGRTDIYTSAIDRRLAELYDKLAIEIKSRL